MARIPLLDLGDLAKVDVERPVRDQLDVVQAHHADPVQVHRGVARSHIDNRLSQRFPDRAAPSGVKGAHHLLAAIGGRTGSQPERIRRMDTAGENGVNIRHDFSRIYNYDTGCIMTIKNRTSTQPGSASTSSLNSLELRLSNSS